MGGAFVYLTVCSMRNRLRARLRRLREPRYLIGAVVGLLYFYSLFLRPGRSGGVLSIVNRSRGPIELAAGTVLFLIAALAWALPGSRRPALAFSRAEVQFLFPAPITRRQLVLYRIVRSQLASLMGSAIVTFFFRPGSVRDGWVFFAGMALVVATLNLHLMGVSLSRESLRHHGLAGLARQWLPVALVSAAVVVLVATLFADWPRLLALGSSRDLVQELQRLGSHGLAGLVLWPFKALVRPPLASSPVEFFRVLPGALVLLALNFIWVVRTDAAFEEASAELAEKTSRLRRGGQPLARRSRWGTTPFTLALAGRPETAVLWKNLILLGRYSILRLVAFVLPGVIIVVVMLSTSARPQSVAVMLTVVCMTLAGTVIFIGPIVMRNDLRQDLAHLAVLKTWPVRGAALVRGEALAPSIVLTGIVWLLIAAAASLAGPLMLDSEATTTASRLSYALAAMLLAPGLIATQVVVQNGIAVMFPAWVSIGTQRAQGVEIMGQRMLMMAGMMFVLVLALVPAAIAALVAGFALYLATSVVPVLLPSAVAAIVMLVECALAAEAFGLVLDRTDVAAVDAPE